MNEIEREKNIRTVYAIRHNPTGKVYVGSSSNLDNRIKHHMYDLRVGKHNVQEMQEDYWEYGNDYSLFVLAEAVPNTKDGRRIEYQWMDILQTRNPLYGYNSHDSTKPFSLDTIKEYVIPSNMEEYDASMAAQRCNTRDVYPKTSFYKAREEAGKTIVETAKAIGVSRQAVHGWERGEYKPYVDTLMKLAAYYKCTVDELLRGEAEK